MLQVRERSKLYETHITHTYHCRRHGNSLQLVCGSSSVSSMCSRAVESCGTLRPYHHEQVPLPPPASETQSRTNSKQIRMKLL